MKRNLILSMLMVSLLVACGGNNTSKPSTNSSSKDSTNNSLTSSITNSNTSLQNSSSLNSSFSENQNSNIELMMYGDLHLNGMRTIYAKLSEEYQGQELVWESSNEAIVTATGREGLSTECLVTANDYGTAYIRASLKDNPNIYTTMKFEIVKGESMPIELFNSIKGSATLKSTDQFIMVDNNYNETITKTEYLDVIYEENDSSNTYTDAYQMTIKNSKGVTTKEYKYVRDENKKQYVATEYLDYRNNVRSQAIETEDGKVYWDFSAYFNPFADSKNVTNLDFETFDGGKTYHYVSYYTGMEGLALSLYLSSFSPDAMWFEVNEDGIRLNTYIEPYNSQTTSNYKYARKVTTDFTNLGTSVINHLKPFERKDYHNDLENAINQVKENNYTINYSITFEDKTSLSYQYKYTSNAIDEMIYNNDELTYHAGYYRMSDEKFATYEYNDETKKLIFIKTYDKKWEESSLYPTFDFAVEVFDEKDVNKYETYETHGALLSRCITLNDALVFALQDSGKATITLNDNKELETLSSVFTMDEEEIKIEATYSNIGTTSIDIDFENGELKADPTNWQEANISLYEELVSWGVEEVIPYLYVPQNYENFTGIKGSMYAVEYLLFNTNLFNSETERDAFIAQYKELLIENGFVEDGVNATSGFTMYTKDGYSIGVGIETKMQMSGMNYVAVETLRAQIIVSSPFIVEAPWAE